ncbi:MAG: hypothetical protein FRX48_07579 [Lasallia pustulata]|uniref:Uncharacterized protein n=1 Tax=Lasallia pustulata TaxID=136370 RepID=A0A5M8PGK4_9LECA|nr:MAG: hypothetical protein FRX48_07579 [Lasallia pustulata]
MDARPQRPVRSVRAHGDENTAPALPANKTIHHRNKSSPALSTMLHVGGLKAAAKRTAFGDVSNTATNTIRPSKDDSVLNGKTGYDVTEKSILFQEQKKPTTLLRPAQRPLNVSGLKGMPSHATNSNNTVASKQPLGETQPATLTNTRKAYTKRNTTIFKDCVPLPVEQPVNDLPKALPSTSSLAPVHQDLVARSQEIHLDVSTVPQPAPSTTQNNLHTTAYDACHVLSNPIETSDEIAPLRSDGVYIDDNGEVVVCNYTDETDHVENRAPIPVGGHVVSAVDNKVLEQINASVTRDAMSERQEKGVTTKHALSLLSDSEEYWITSEHKLPIISTCEGYWDGEEETVENYDEEGSTIARSLKSRGDNTTGVATTILFPKVDQKVKREIAAARELVEGTRTAEDIEDETWDTSMVAEYGKEIFDYMRELEIKMLPNAYYMEKQAEIQWSMRSVLMDWLVQVHHRFGLLPETLYLCVNYIDRFLSCKVVSLSKLQLVGATAIFVAAKYEEINCPSVQEIVYMVDGGYTADEILKAERFMLTMLQFELGWPGPMSFLRRISKADDYDLETRTLAKYFLEVTIMDERFVGSPPSFTAAGAHCLARMMLKKGNWSPAHVYYSNYTYSQLHSLILLMLECCETPFKHHVAIFEKYTDRRYKRASLFVESEMQKGFQVRDVPTNRAANIVNLYDDRPLWLRK